MGRTPVPVAESTRQPREKPFTPGEALGGRVRTQGVYLQHMIKGKGSLMWGLKVFRRGGEPNWALLQPSEPRKPLGEGTTKNEMPSQTTGKWGERPHEQRHPTPDQQLIEADTRCRKRLAALARDHIVKLREERQWMAYD